jgi:hypothetical protein
MGEPQDTIPLHIRLPLDVAAALQDQGIDLVAALADQGHEVRRAALPDPTRPATGSKDAGLVILASGGAAYLVGLAIVRIIKAVTGRPVVGELGELRPVLDAAGKPMRHADGEPVLYWSKEKQLLDPALAPKASVAHMTLPGLLEIEVRDS